MPDVLTAVRYAVFGVVALAALAALGSWLVRTRRISPFSALGRGLRAGSDAVLRPVERRLIRMGGNPVHAGGWLVVLSAVAGIVFLSLLGWLLATFQRAQLAALGGPRATAALIIGLVYSVLVFALLARVIGSWFGIGRYTRWMRPAYVLTDWIVEPIRRLLPSFGPFDVSPLVAWLALWLLRRFLLMAL
ncbi:MAG: YggT family protein [Gemmatimonadales bacterium]